MSDLDVTDLHTARIVVVDDEEMNLRLLKRILEKDGYSEVTFVEGGKDIERLVRDVDPHLLLLDLHMPPPDGFEILRCLAP